MKKYWYLIIPCFLLLIASCEKFLYDQPDGSRSDNQRLNTEKDAQEALNSIYISMDAQNAYSILTEEKEESLSQTGNNLESIVSIRKEPIIKNNSGYSSKAYQGFYKTICLSNNLITGLEKQSIKEEEKREQILGEAYIIRAMSYLNLVRRQGACPLVLNKEDLIKLQHQQKADRDEIYDQIINDLNKGYALLPEAHGNASKKLNKATAKALLAMAFYQRAEGNLDSPFWEEAYDAAQSVYNRQCYQLNQTGREAILEIPAGQVNSGNPKGKKTVEVFTYREMLLMLAKSANAIEKKEEAKLYVGEILDKVQDARGE